MYQKIGQDDKWKERWQDNLKPKEQPVACTFKCLLWKYQHNYKESDNDEERNDFFHEDAPNTFLLVYCENECIMTHIVKEKRGFI